MKSRCEKCRFHASEYFGVKALGAGCDYLSFTGKSRIAQVYKQLGVKTLTEEAEALLQPKNCSFFEPGERKLLPGTRLRQYRCSFDEAAARRLWEQGACDREIAEATGATRAQIGGWRRKRGLACRYERVRLSAARDEAGQELRRLWEQGMTDKQIAAVLGVSGAAVGSLRKEMGLENRYRPHPIDRERVLRLLAEGKNDREIAEALGRRTSAVQKWRKRHGIPSRREKEKAHEEV